jgi:hypothetical protein
MIVFKPPLITARAMRVVCERADARKPRSALMAGRYRGVTNTRAREKTKGIRLPRRHIA